MLYTHQTITINQREAALSEIISGSAVSFSGFESETFLFIKNWLTELYSISLQTSGSTGTPKKIHLTREQLKQSAHRTIKALRLSEKNTALVCLDTKYIAGKMMLVRALEANMKIIAVEPSSNPLKNIFTQPDFGAFVPLQLDEILKDESSTEKLNQFQSILLGGAAVSLSLLQKIKTLTCDVYATYGMTETVSHIALQKLNGTKAQNYFETLPGVKIKMDERECLVIESPGFKERIITNDLVQIIDDSHFKILGRYDNIINSGGVKLVPEEIEKKIEPLLFGEAFFLSSLPDERLGQKLILLIESEPQREIANILKGTLPPYEVPKEIYYVNEFIRTDTQKINRTESVKKALKTNS